MWMKYLILAVTLTMASSYMPAEKEQDDRHMYLGKGRSSCPYIAACHDLMPSVTMICCMMIHFQVLLLHLLRIFPMLMFKCSWLQWWMQLLLLIAIATVSLVDMVMVWSLGQHHFVLLTALPTAIVTTVVLGQATAGQETRSVAVLVSKFVNCFNLSN